MFIGHFGIGFGAKKAAPAVSLGTLFLAAQFLDLLWPVLLLLGIEHAEIKPGTGHSQPIAFTDYPVSHSLLAVAGWGILFALVYWIFKKNIGHAIVLGLCVISHWLLDLVVHLPDLPLHPGAGAPLYGFQLWNSFWGTLIVEGSFFLVGFYLYLKNTKAKNKQGILSLWILVALLVMIHIANITGPPPPSMDAVAWAGNLQWLFVILAYWTDRNRSYN
ncbi:MAG TPA: hypothetical protein PKM83_08155 [Ferruginibacter sp.]|nr:hypothetical protein [Ferruginibacter sp.]